MTAPIAVSTIAAQAFRFMELGPVSSFSDDTEQAQSAAEQYPLAMASCLEACDWSFASVLAFLPEVAAGVGHAVDEALPYSFLIPPDVVMLREVGSRAARWRRDRGILRANEPGPLKVRYTGQITDETNLPATFQAAVALRLASLLAPRWLGTASKIEALEARAAQSLKSAMANDAGNASPERYDGLPEQPDWLTEALT